MMFRYPLMFLLLLLLPGLLYLRHGRLKRAALRFSSGKNLKRLAPGWAVLAQPVLPALFGIGLALLIVALARPQKGLEESKVRAHAVDIVLALDLSTSMNAEDFSTAARRISRFEASREVIRNFVQSRTSDRIGLIGFSAMPYSVAPLTLDHGWLISQLDRLQTGMLEDGTAIGDAIASASNRLRDSEAKTKLIILLTDGINNRGRISPLNAAHAAKALGIKMYVVGAASVGGSQTPWQDPFGFRRIQHHADEIDDKAMTAVAEVTGGSYFRAGDLKSLEEVYRQIDEMEKTEIDVDHYTSFEERFMPWLMAGIACLGLEKLLSLTRLGRLP